MSRYRPLWSSFRHLIDFQYEEFRNYNSFVENSLKAELRGLEKRCKATLKSLSKERCDELGDLYSDEFCQFTKDFPQLLRRTTFMALYSHFEQELTAVCRLCKKHVPKTGADAVSLDDLRGEGIERARVFLAKVVGVAFPSSAHPWQEILKYNKLRNWLVHAGPHLGRSDKAARLKSMIVQLPHITVSASDEIELGADFCEKVIEKMEAFFESLFNVLPQS